MRTTTIISKIFSVIILIIISFTTYSQEFTLEDSLVAWYPFNGNANDESGNANNGTISGPSLTVDRFGNENCCYSFNGSGDYIYVNASSSLNTATNQGTTVNVWVNVEDYESSTVPSLVYYGVNVGQPSINNILQDSVVRASNFIFGQPHANCYSTTKIIPGNWYCISYIYNTQDSLVQVYVNGQFENETKFHITNPINPHLEMGRDPYAGGSQYFHGKLDDIRIFNCALDSAQIWQLYTIDGIMLNLPDTIMACHEETIELDAGAGYSSYLWSNGETTQTILVSETGTYIVTVEDDFNNIATDSTYINIINAYIAQNDTTICAGEGIELSMIGGGTANITDGLVAWYPFNGNAEDESGNGNDGTIYGDTYLTPDRFEKNNKAYYFDGDEDYLTVPTSPSLNNISQDQITMCAWAKPEAYGLIFQLNTVDFNGGGYSYYISTSADNKFSFVNWNHNNPGAWSLTTPLSYNVNQWHFICVTIDPVSDQTKMYVDGQFSISCSNTVHTLPPPVLLYIGRAHNGSADFSGKIDDIRLYGKIISEDEIETLYLEGICDNSYLWSTGDTTATITVSPTETTTYWVDITDGINTCRDTITVYVNEINLTLADTLMACHEDSLLLDAGAGFETYLWSTGDTTQTLSVFETGTYLVTVENNVGCLATDSSYVNIINAQIAQNDTTIVAGESIELSISGGSSANITDGLVGYWPFNGDAMDMSGNGNDGTVFGATSFSDRFGNDNSAYYFDGVDDYILVPASPSLDTLHSISLSCWVYCEGLPGVVANTMIHKSANQYGYTFDILEYNGSKLRLLKADNSFKVSNFEFYNDAWFHVVGVYHDGFTKYYINGQADTLYSNSSGILTNTVDLRIGHSQPGHEQFLGKIDDIMIYNRELNPTEIQTLYYEGTGNYTYLWSTGDTTASISVSPTETTTYFVEINDGINWCTDSVTVTVEHPVELELKAFLEGAFLITNMLRYLNLLGFMPLEQPYNAEPWNYFGDEVVAEIPFLAVDWVLVELRETEGDVTTATSNKVIARKACFIRNDGIITDLDGSSPLTINAEINNNVYVVLYHRNHLPVISANPLEFNAGIYEYDFTEFPEQVFGGVNSCVEVGVDTWGLASGDGNNNKEIDNIDKNDIWLPNRGQVGYNIGDYNMDGQVNTSDKVVYWEPNSGKGSKIPD